MSFQRVVVAMLLAGMLAAALLLDGFKFFDEFGVSETLERDVEQLAVPMSYSVPVFSRENGTWFCPGGSAPGGLADVSLEIINASTEPAEAIVSGIRSGLGAEPTDAVVTVEAGERTRVRLADLVTDSSWMAAVVEVDSADVVLEQTYLGAAGTSDRALCHTRTSDQWVVASGATRFAAHGEEMILLFLNPFPHDAVLNIRFDSDVGVDTLNGVVVPARRVVAVDVTEEVPAASRVSAVADVVVGRVAASRVQSQGHVSPSTEGGPVGLSVTPATSMAAPVWHLPDLNSADRDEVVSVVNPSLNETAEVDLVIVSDEDLSRDPVELTIGPGAASQVRLSDVSRLSGLASYSVTADSLTGLPIAVMLESTDSSLGVGGGVSVEGGSDAEGSPGFDLGPENVSVAATTGLDVSSTRWLAPLGSGSHRVVILNPSSTSIATVEAAVLEAGGRRVVAQLEIAPLRRVSLSASELGGGRPIVEVVSSAPVVVGRDLRGVSQHQLLPGVAVAEPTPLSRN
ncbi:MAG: hypothetical protein OXF75_09395 [Acidimicrobiaceae bacterium]|nr:hypothetical protein [Acidimicrobiaceae bacterium]